MASTPDLEGLNVPVLAAIAQVGGRAELDPPLKATIFAKIAIRVPKRKGVETFVAESVKARRRRRFPDSRSKR